MANAAEIAGQRPRRCGRPTPVEAVPPGGASRGLAAMARAGDSGEVVFTRNEVMREALGGRTWRGALANLAGPPCDDVVVRIHFHDREGRPVGSPVTAHADRLGTGAALHLQARLPAAAVGMRVHSLRWTAGGESIAPGPSGPWAFDVVET